MRGDSDIFSKPKNYNFELKRENNEKLKFNILKGGILLSLVPIFIFVKNAEQNFRNAQIKELTAKRRERLDKEHGINREEWKESVKELDKMYRITEKEEIEKFRQVGKTADDYYKQKEQHDKKEQDLQKQTYVDKDKVED